MCSPLGQLVLASSDAGLRSMLSAQLVMAGEMPISTASHLDSALGPALRATALLIIEDTLVCSPSQAWSDVLRNQGWGGCIIVVVDAMPAHPPGDERIAYVEKRHAGTAIMSLLQLWRLQPCAQLTLPE